MAGPPSRDLNAPRVIRVRAGGAGSGGAPGRDPAPGLRTGNLLRRLGRPGFGAVSYAGSERTDCIASSRGASRVGGCRGSSGPFGRLGGGGVAGGLSGVWRGAGAPMIGPARVDEPGDPSVRCYDWEKRGRASQSPACPTPVSFVAAARPSMTLKGQSGRHATQRDLPRARSAQRRGAVPDMPRGETRGPGAGPAVRSQ